MPPAALCCSSVCSTSCPACEAALLRGPLCALLQRLAPPASGRRAGRATTRCAARGVYSSTGVRNMPAVWLGQPLQLGALHTGQSCHHGLVAQMPAAALPPALLSDGRPRRACPSRHAIRVAQHPLQACTPCHPALSGRNPDGVFRGHLRTNAAGANLNREVGSSTRPACLVRCWGACCPARLQVAVLPGTWAQREGR